MRCYGRSACIGEVSILPSLNPCGFTLNICKRTIAREDVLIIKEASTLIIYCVVIAKPLYIKRFGANT